MYPKVGLEIDKHYSLELCFSIVEGVAILPTLAALPHSPLITIPTSKCMHGMNQTEAEYSKHGKRSQRASLSQIGPVVPIGGVTRHLLRMRTIGHVT